MLRKAKTTTVDSMMTFLKTKMYYKVLMSPALSLGLYFKNVKAIFRKVARKPQLDFFTLVSTT